MTYFRRLVPGLLLGLTIAMAGVSFAQNPKSTAVKTMESCCCKDSCPMLKTEGTKSTATSDKQGCCCCGDSCDMKGGAMNNHSATGDTHECCCCGDSCAMKDPASKTTGTSEKHDCCCGDSCDMKDGAMKNMAMTGAAKDKQNCCCCGSDSCNMKNMKDMKNKGQ